MVRLVQSVGSVLARVALFPQPFDHSLERNANTKSRFIGRLKLQLNMTSFKASMFRLESLDVHGPGKNRFTRLANLLNSEDEETIKP